MPPGITWWGKGWVKNVAPAFGPPRAAVLLIGQENLIAWGKVGIAILYGENTILYMPMLNTKLESEAAEFFVLGNLLLNGITTFKTYTNFPGYDLIATDAINNSSARTQVKSRYVTNWGGFIINNFDCDFVVLVTLNRGYSKIKKSGDCGIRLPEFYILPINYVLQVRDPNNNWGKINKSRLIDYDKYINKWNLIKEFLQNINKADK